MSVMVSRKAVSVGISILGAALVFLAIILPPLSVNLGRQVLVALLGILLIEAGVWKLAERVLPTQRRYHALRAEVARFLELTRSLNARAVEVRAVGSDDVHAALEEDLQALHATVERMAEVAGKEGEE
jgi:hypothetical protein